MRRQKTSLDMNLDSLLDTMTNVVGILVILLAVTQLGVGEAIKQFVGEGEMSKITDEAFDKETKELEVMHIKLNELREQYDQKKINLDQMQEDLDDYRQLFDEFDLIYQSDKSLDARKIDDEVDDLRRRRYDLREEIRQFEKKREAVRAFLEQSNRDGPKERVISIPVITPVPSDFKPVCFVCQHGRLYSLNNDILVEKVNTTVQKVVGSSSLRDVVINGQRIERYFESNIIGDENFRIMAKSGQKRLPDRIEYTLGFELRLRDFRKGETIQELRSQDSAFLRKITSLDPKKFFIKFFVWSDSFETYIDAIEMAKHQLPNLESNWIPMLEGEKLKLGSGEGETIQ